MRGYQTELVTYLERIGATAIAIDGGRCGHPQLSFDFRGQRFRTGIAATPSDRNAAIIKINEIRATVGLRPTARRDGRRRSHAIRRPRQRPSIRCPVLTPLPDWHETLRPLLEAMLREAAEASVRRRAA